MFPPKSKYWVNVSLLMGLEYLIICTGSFWLRCIFIDHAGGQTPTPDAGVKYVISGELPPLATYSMLAGFVVLDNTCNVAKTYHLA